MSILSIIFALISSLISFGIVYYFKELSKTHDWAFNVGAACLVAATLLMNYIRDKISEKDPASKLHKATSEIKALKENHTNETAKTELKHNNEINQTTIKHEAELEQYKKEIALLQGKLSIKDTIIHQIRSGITSKLIEHGRNDEFFDFVKNLADKMNSDFDMNTLAPVVTPETKKYIDMLR